MATDYFDMMERADQHYHDPAQFHLTEFGPRTDGGTTTDAPPTEVAMFRGYYPDTRDSVYVGRGAEKAHINNTEIGERGWLGNPYPLNDERTREEVVEQYRRDFEQRLQKDAAFRDAVRDLAGSVLLCWCQEYGADAPKCHAEVIAEHADRLRREGV